MLPPENQIQPPSAVEASGDGLLVSAEFVACEQSFQARHLALCGLPDTQIGVTIAHPYWEYDPNRQRVARTVEVRLEPFVPIGAADPEIERLVRLERDAWGRNGIDVAEDAVRERILGAPEREIRPNPVIVARIDGEIQGAIFTSWVTAGDRYEGIPRAYSELARMHDPSGDTIFDYSVITNQTDINVRRYGLFEPLVRSTQALAAILNKQQVIAYSRAEFMAHHILHNPRLDEFRDEHGSMQADAVWTAFHAAFPAPNFRDLASFFGFEPTLDQLHGIAAALARKATRGFAPSPEILREYFTFSRWADLETDSLQALSDYARLHIEQVGDPYLAACHQRLGAQYVLLIPESRSADRRSLGSNVMMRYEVNPEAARSRDLAAFI